MLIKHRIPTVGDISVLGVNIFFVCFLFSDEASVTGDEVT